jgi:hypothetical protein
MTFFYGSIAMAIFCLGWLGYRVLVKNDIAEHMEELRVGAFVLGVWAIVWWLLFR